MTWTASLAGGARVNWDAPGAASLPPALRNMSLEVAFDAAVVERCRLTVSQPVLRAPLVSALDTIIS
jgi:hypothetical protein